MRDQFETNEFAGKCLNAFQLVLLILMPRKAQYIHTV